MKPLLAAAAEARAHAYAPYSRHAVGAAVRSVDGTVFTGCNVESASYGLTTCAERVAVFRAVAAGHVRFDAIAIVSGPGARMCGACRAVFAEFAPPDALVALGAADGSAHKRRLDELLPDAHG